MHTHTNILTWTAEGLQLLRIHTSWRDARSIGQLRWYKCSKLTKNCPFCCQKPWHIFLLSINIVEHSFHVPQCQVVVQQNSEPLLRSLRPSEPVWYEMKDSWPAMIELAHCIYMYIYIIHIPSAPTLGESYACNMWYMLLHSICIGFVSHLVVWVVMHMYTIWFWVWLPTFEFTCLTSW